MRATKNTMKANVGSYDCAARFVIGCLVLLAANHFHSWWGLLGILPILNAIVSFCPLYAVLGTMVIPLAALLMPAFDGAKEVPTWRRSSAQSYCTPRHRPW